jgi:phosphate transport system substrate-binding protein
LFKLVRLAAAGAAVVMGGVLLSACGPPPQDNIGIVGSFTTQNVMDALSIQYAGHANSSNPGNDTLSNIPAGPLTGTQTADIPAKNNCPGIHYSTSNQPPNGSSAGVSALVADTNGCIDLARSSRGRSPSDPSNIDFYAYAIDGVSWAGFGGGHQPLSLTQNQLQGIYLCTNAGNPQFTDWSQVGGSAGAIVRYLPQTGSGTLSFFETRILGLSSAQQGVLDDSSCNAHPIRIEESHGDQVASGFRPFAILPYSFADWNAQQNGVTTDFRAGSFLGAINGVGPSSSSLAEGCSTCFLGRRFVYNVIKQGSPEVANAINFAGVDSGHNGWICSNDNVAKFEIAAYGFVGLPFASAGSGLPNSTCRKNPTPL